MSTLDAGFFFVEHTDVPMHLGSLVVFDGPAPGFGEVVRAYARELPRVPRYQQVVRTVPLQLVRPYWVDDEHFDIREHLRHLRVPAPGRGRQVRRAAAEIFARPLDRTRPLWETWFLDGLAGGRWALLSKVHHCLVDGIGGTDLMAEVFDAGPDPAPRAPARWDPAPEPATGDLLARGLLDAVSASARGLATLPGLVRRLPARQEAAGYGRGLAASARRLAVPSASSLNGPIGPRRRWAWASASFAAVKEIRGAHGGTVNDVLLAVVTRGFRDLLAARGELEDGVVVRTLVPVSIRTPDEHGILTNRLSALLANLPVAEPDPLRRLALVREEMDELKATGQAAGPEALTGLLGLLGSPLLAAGLHAAFQLPQPLVQTVTTNVPGPPFPLFLLGRRMVKAYPYVGIGDNERISVAIYSYLGRFAFGITADYDAVPDLSVLTRGIRHGLAELRPQPARQGI
ncbi:MAG: wax ester/triacylglycerol synthase family O-acyltransferase [Gemmatimonadota bacterium]